MEATSRRSSSRIPTFIAFAVLASLSFLVIFSSSWKGNSVMHLQRRAVTFVARQGVGPSPAPLPPGGMPSPGASLGSSSVTTSSGPTTTTSTSTSSGTTTSSSSSLSRSSSRSTSSSTSTTVPTSVSSSSVSESTRISTSTEIKTEIKTSTTSSGAQARTTLVITGDIIATSAQTFSIQPSASAPPGSTSAVSAASTGFWKNKAAVAGTFVVVALVIIGIAAIFIISFFKKRNVEKQNRLHEELFEKYSETGRSNSPGLSIHDAPMDPFATREVHYDNSNNTTGYHSQHQNSSASAHLQHPPPSSADSHQTTYYTPSSSQHSLPPSKSQYLPPSRAFNNSTSAAPPVSFRNPAARDSYQPSIDSFYGAAGQRSDGRI